MDIRLDIELLDIKADDYTNVFYCDFLSHVLKKRKQEETKSSSYRFAKSDVKEIMKNPPPRPKTDLNQSLGYEEDSFIDNKEPFDECLPHDMETLLGGHYVNHGKLQFKSIVLKESKDISKTCQKDIGNVDSKSPSLSSSTKIVAGKDKAKASGGESLKNSVSSSKSVVPVICKVGTSDFKKNETVSRNKSENSDVGNSESKSSSQSLTKIITGRSKAKISGEESRKNSASLSKLVVPIAYDVKNFIFQKNELASLNNSENSIMRNVEAKSSLSSSTKITSGKSKAKISGEESRINLSKLVVPVVCKVGTSNFTKNETVSLSKNENSDMGTMEAKSSSSSSSLTKVVAGKSKAKTSGEESRKNSVSKSIVPVICRVEDLDFKQNRTVSWNNSEHSNMSNVDKKLSSLSSSTKILAGKNKLIVSGEKSRKNNVSLSKLVVPVVCEVETSNLKKNETVSLSSCENSVPMKAETECFSKKGTFDFKRIDASCWRISENVTMKKVESRDFSRKESFDLKKIEPTCRNISDNPVPKEIESPYFSKNQISNFKKIEPPCRNSSDYPVPKEIESLYFLKKQTSDLKKIESPCRKISDDPTLKDIKSQFFLKKLTSDFQKIDASSWKIGKNITLEKVESHSFPKKESTDFTKIDPYMKISPIKAVKKMESQGRMQKEISDFESSCTSVVEALKKVEPHNLGKTKTSILNKVTVGCLASGKVTSTTKQVESSSGVKSSEILNSTKVEKRRKRQMEHQLKKVWVSLPHLVEIAALAKKSNISGESFPLK